jgi:hypothetical protein
MKLALLLMIASAVTRQIAGVTLIPDALFYAAGLLLLRLFHNDLALRPVTTQMPAAATVRAVRA